MLLGNEFQKAADLYTKGIWARMSNENFVPVKLAGELWMLLGNEFQKAADLYTKGIWARMSNENFVPVKLAGNHLDKLSRYLKSEIGK